jgi:hypothetical protein
MSHRYEKLVSEAKPVVIQTEAEYERLLRIVKDSMDIQDEAMSEEEGRLLELLRRVEAQGPSIPSQTAAFRRSSAGNGASANSGEPIGGTIPCSVGLFI